VGNDQPRLLDINANVMEQVRRWSQQDSTHRHRARPGASRCDPSDL
jgi:hypothetical protein